MPDILIQFHATPEELLPVMQTSAKEFGVHIVAIRHFPFRASEIERGELAEVLTSAEYAEVAFTLWKPVVAVSKGSEFIDKNPGELRLQVGRMSARGLEESALSARTSNVQVLEVWKKIAKKLKAVTKAGAVAVNPDTGETAFSRNHRFTPGAKRLELAGIPILTLSGGCVFRLGAPRDDQS